MHMYVTVYMLLNKNQDSRWHKFSCEIFTDHMKKKQHFKVIK